MLALPNGNTTFYITAVKPYLTDHIGATEIKAEDAEQDGTENSIEVIPIPAPTTAPAKRPRGRPRKYPLEADLTVFLQEETYDTSR